MKFIKENRDLLLFLIKLGTLCAFYFLWFSPKVWTLPFISTLWGHFIHYTLLFLIEPAIWILNSIGYGAQVVNERYIDMYDLEFNVLIKNFCLGVDMMFTLTALIIAFPGKWTDRLWFIPVGLIGIHFINIARVVALCIAWVKFGNTGPIDHHDWFNVVAVVFIFLLFVVWVNRYERKPA